MTKAQNILAASTLALTLMIASFTAVSIFMPETSEIDSLQSQVAAYRANEDQLSDKAVNVTLIADDFLTANAQTVSQRDYLQIQALSPVTAAHHKAAKLIKSEQVCLAQAVYYEARSEARSGQMAVAEVVQNRVKSKHYPNTICGVVYQGSGRKSGCQFSFTCDGSMEKMPAGKNWDEALQVATLMQTHDVASLTNGATHYHTTAIKPVWSTDLRFNRQIGSHKFYRFNFTERPVVAAPSHAIAPPI